MKTCGQCYWFKPSNKCLKGKRLQTYSVLNADSCAAFKEILIDYSYHTGNTAKTQYTEPQVVSVTRTYNDSQCCRTLH